MTDSRRSIAARSAAHLRDTGAATITTLSRALDVSRTSVEKAIVTLEQAGLIGEAPPSASSGTGRPARRLAFDAGAGIVAGVDVGVSRIRVLLSDLSGRVFAHRDYSGVHAHGDAAAKLSAVIAHVQDAVSTSSRPDRRVLAAGVSLPGIVDVAGRVTASVVIPEWSGIDIGAGLSRALGCPVSVDNGVRLAARAEHHLGVAQYVDDLLYLSVGNRIAMGLILDAHPRRGTHDAAGDIGRFAFRGLADETGRIHWRTAPTAEQVFERARAGDADAREELTAFTEELSRGLATLVMTVDPAMVVVGGGLSEAHEELLAPLRDGLQRHIALPFRIPVVAARLGASAAAHGALVLAFEQHASAIYRLDDMPMPVITPHDADAADTLESAASALTP